MMGAKIVSSDVEGAKYNLAPQKASDLIRLHPSCASVLSPWAAFVMTSDIITFDLTTSYHRFFKPSSRFSSTYCWATNYN